jgi:hypothetical protein
MSTSQPSPQQTQQPPDLTPAYHTFQHYTALGFLFGAPILIALPPRKLDFYTFALGSSWVLSANHLYRERARQRVSPFGGSSQRQAQVQVPEGELGVKKTRYEIAQAQLKREREDAARRRQLLDPQQAGVEHVHGRPQSAIEKGLEKVWMGDEKPGWKERRLAEEQEKISGGEGYGGMIMDQIWEVWNWGREKGEELEGRDREVLRERRRREEFPEVGKEKGK